MFVVAILNSMLRIKFRRTSCMSETNKIGLSTWHRRVWQGKFDKQRWPWQWKPSWNKHLRKPDWYAIIPLTCILYCWERALQNTYKLVATKRRWSKYGEWENDSLFGNFTSLFGRLRQRNQCTCTPHVQHDYFSSFNQSYHYFQSEVAVALQLSLLHNS